MTTYKKNHRNILEKNQNYIINIGINRSNFYSEGLKIIIV